MSYITDISHFNNEPTVLPNTDPATSEGQKLTRFIEQYEPEYLTNILGYELKKAFVNGIGDAGIYDALRDGAEYTDLAGRLQKWRGFSAIGANPIACYITWMFLKSTASNLFSIGTTVANAENGKRVSPEEKMRAAWNYMVELNNELHAFLTINEDDYPEYLGLNMYFGGQLTTNQIVAHYRDLFIKQTALY